VAVTVQRLADLVQGEVRGDAARTIVAAHPLGDAGPDDVSFLEGEKQLRLLSDCRAAALVVPTALLDKLPKISSIVFIAVPDALSAFVILVEFLHGRPLEGPHGIDPLASVHPSAVIGPEVSIMPFACVGAGTVLGARCRVGSGVVLGRDCRIGDDVILHPNAVLYDGTILGARVIVHANAVLGADGFGYRLHQGQHRKVPQLGWVEIGDDVEIGACATVDRGTFQATRVGPGTKIDNLVMIGHNCRIGSHNLLAGQVGIAGSTATGTYVVMAGQVGVADHLNIGDGALLGARAGVAQDVPAGERHLGTPARPEREAKRILLSLARLPDLCRDVRRILRHLGLAETDPPTVGRVADPPALQNRVADPPALQNRVADPPAATGGAA
jgi:UDP-3-O-[3-hydroxymyristoyl] glucosamine N-acyltransferase